MAQAYRVRSRIARLIVRGLFAAVFRVRHYGTLPAHGPLLVVANHQGWADGFLLAASFPLSAKVWLLGDREGTGKVWWWRAVLRAVGIVIPIERASTAADRAAIGATLAALEQGGIVVVFAEGRVSRVESSLGPFARGVGYLALRSRREKTCRRKKRRGPSRWRCTTTSRGSSRRSAPPIRRANGCAGSRIS